ncbi:MAG: hypothetical protein LWW93_13505 [Hyphomicrobiales bacterium]|nr:hypothetical protein [Hyphomicrobiales bacterium]
MSMLRVLRTVLACLHLLVGIGVGMTAGPALGHHAPTAAMAFNCADHAGGMTTTHHATKPPCGPAGKLADHRHCPNCPIGGSCTDLPTATTVSASGLVATRSASRPASRASTDPTGRNPLPDPRPPRAVA